MKKVGLKLILLFSFAWITYACIDPFEAESLEFKELLVIEGLLTDQRKAHEIKISRSFPFDSETPRPEEGATVWIQTRGGENILLTEARPGIYQTEATLRPRVGEHYQLFVTTQDQRQYASAEVLLKKNPPIDSVHARFIPSEAGIQIFIDTHDFTGETQFFRWEYEETYEIRTPFPSRFEWLGGNRVVERTQEVGICWVSDTSDNIFVKSLTGIQGGRVINFPIRFLDADSQLPRVRYSILVKQYALDEQTFEFWDKLREINEQQGTLFDIQPGNVSGNIRSLNGDNEEVLGYFDASQVSITRSFFSPDDFVGEGFIPRDFGLLCQNRVDTVSPSRIGEYMAIGNNSTTREIWEVQGAAGVSDILFLLVPRECANCTDLGTNVRPSFW